MKELRSEEEEPGQRDHRLASERRSQRKRLEDSEEDASNMSKFHECLSSLTSPKCDTCFERFPSLSVTSQPNGINECSRCAHDKSIPKQYSSANNMDPGSVPLQLQVCFSLIKPLNYYNCYY